MIGGSGLAFEESELLILPFTVSRYLFYRLWRLLTGQWMPDVALIVLKWTLVALAASPIVIGLAWGVVENMILPRFIPGAEIERLADSIMQRYPLDPAEAAFIEEHAAWFRSEGYDQGKWRRVRRLIRRRLENG